jgi:putative DNA primase/helicase
MTNYFSCFKEKSVENNPLYPHNDIGISRLFYDLHSAFVCYVVEAKTWYVYTGKRWIKDEGGLRVMERCKDFVQALAKYAENLDDGSEESKAFVKYTANFHARRKREGLLYDARSISPKSLAAFDRDKLLFNCHNGTLSLSELVLRPHKAEDYITKISRVNYVEGAVCERWERFISEVMCGDADTARFLQKAFGYCLSGETHLECFFILYGNTTRNGKSTLSETVAYVLGEYARTIQPQTLSRRPDNGAAASPDTARLKGARLVNTPEPEKGLELNVALVKQLTGGDTYTGRFLNENPIEFKPEFKIFINTNHLPRTADDTVFSSDRVKLIPFDRHFTPEEQDAGLKKLFRKHESMSGILNWTIEGYRLLRAEGLNEPGRVVAATAAYRLEADIIGSFLCECTAAQEGNRLPASELYAAYSLWAKDNGYRQMNHKNFVVELRRRLDVRRGGVGNVVVGVALDSSQNPFTE